MGLAATVTKAASAAFASAGDLVATVTWRKRTFGAYDPTTGVQAVSTSDTSVSAVVGQLSRSQRESAGVSDRAIGLYVLTSTLGGVAPAKGDQVIHGGITYEVKQATWKGTTDIWMAVADV